MQLNLFEPTDLEAAPGVAMALDFGTSAEPDPITEARSYRAQMDADPSLTPESIARTDGTSAERVRSRLSLLTLLADIQHWIKIGNLPPAYAAMMVGLDAYNQRKALLSFTDTPKMTLLKFKVITDALHAKQRAAQPATLFTPATVTVTTQDLDTDPADIGAWEGEGGAVLPEQSNDPVTPEPEPEFEDIDTSHDCLNCGGEGWDWDTDAPCTRCDGFGIDPESPKWVNR